MAGILQQTVWCEAEKEFDLGRGVSMKCIHRLGHQSDHEPWRGGPTWPNESIGVGGARFLVTVTATVETDGQDIQAEDIGGIVILESGEEIGAYVISEQVESIVSADEEE